MLGKARASGKNTAALWTFTANPYRKLGKHGQVNCLHFAVVLRKCLFDVLSDKNLIYRAYCCYRMDYVSLEATLAR